MKLALDLHTNRQAPLFHLNARLRKALVAMFSALAPYAVAALALFAYHEQWFR